MSSAITVFSQLFRVTIAVPTTALVGAVKGSPKVPPVNNLTGIPEITV